MTWTKRRNRFEVTKCALWSEVKIDVMNIACHSKLADHPSITICLYARVRGPGCGAEGEPRCHRNGGGDHHWHGSIANVEFASHTFECAPSPYTSTISQCMIQHLLSLWGSHYKRRAMSDFTHSGSTRAKQIVNHIQRTVASLL